MIASILPDNVASEETFDDPPGAELFPEEEDLVRNAVEKRRREFTTARHCARQALSKLGLPSGPILHRPGGAPVWPRSVVGSMTHCLGYRAAAVAPADSFSTIGIDAEPHAPLPDGVLGIVAVPEEVAWIESLLTSQPSVRWDRLLFSIKESVYKAWFPLTHSWLDFDGACVTVDPARRTFTARLTVAGPRIGSRVPTSFPGRWLAVDDLVVTAIALPRWP